MQATWQAGYWVENMRYACFTGRHLAVALGLGIPALLLLGLGVKGDRPGQHIRR